MDYLLILLQNLGKIEATPPVVIILIFLCLLFFFISVVCSGGEQAFSYLDEKDIKAVKAKDNNESKKLALIMERPRMLIVTVLCVRIISTVLLIFILNALIDFMVSIEVFPTWSITIKIVVIFTLLALFTETLPRAYARQKKMRMAFFAAPLVSSLINIFEPISLSLIRASNWLSFKVFKKNKELLTLKDLNDAFSESSDSQEDIEEKNILRGLIGLEDIVVKQVMRPRLDILGISEEASFQELVNIVDKVSHPRIPVYSGDLDHIVGVVNIKDLIAHLGKDVFDWLTVLQPVVFVHEQKMIKSLLKEFQSAHTHFAIVVDEFGGTSGIITMKDIMEEIVGDIRNEFDLQEEFYEKVAENEYLFDGKTALTECIRILNLPLGYFNDVKGGSESLGGLLLELSGRFPEKNQQISCNGFTFIPVSLNKFRIEKVKIIVP